MQLMRTFVLVAGAVFAARLSHAAIITQWNFNSPVPDADTTTGTLSPYIGSGAASIVGSPTNFFVTGDTAAGHDPAGSVDNSSWETKGYPTATNNNKSAGVRFDSSTVGYTNITLSWWQQNSSSASRYARLQYTVDGSAFVDADLITMSADSTFIGQTADLSTMPGIANNPAFGFRIVTEFESTAIGSGTNAYVATGEASYRTTGTIRFDMVTIAGTPIPDGNTPPYIFASIPDLTLRPNHTSAALPFLILDAETPAKDLTLLAVSSDSEVIPAANVVFGGSGADRTLTITAGTQPGCCRLSVYVIDPGGKSNSLSFAVTVLPDNLAPSISTIPNQNTLVSVPTPAIQFEVSDPETSADRLLVTAVSGNPSLVPNTSSALAFGGSGSNRTISITPAAGQLGVAPIRVNVSDGTNTTSTVFPLVVVPSAATLLYEPFSYTDGSLLTNSGFLWNNRSGVYGQCQVSSGKLQITAAQTEDVTGPLIGGPYAKGSNTVLYASFQLKFLSLPGFTSGYFAHFGSGAALRGRISAGTLNAQPGFFHLFVANGSDTNSMLAWNLSTNVAYTVVARYVIDPPTTTLWLNPAGESDPGATATDSATSASISAFGFRQDADIGAAMQIDDLRVGLSFASVTSAIAPAPIPLNIQRDGSNVILSWANAAFTLQSAPAANGIFTNIPAALSPYTNPMAGPARFFRLRAN